MLIVIKEPVNNLIEDNKATKELRQTLTSESHIRTTASSPALMMVLFKGPQTALLILP